MILVINRTSLKEDLLLEYSTPPSARRLMSFFDNLQTLVLAVLGRKGHVVSAVNTLTV
jgi:hypothetical protein